MIPDNNNLREEGSLGVTVGEFSGCGGELEVAAHTAATVKKQRLRDAYP